jgi:hypothetical protein
MQSAGQFPAFSPQGRLHTPLPQKLASGVWTQPVGEHWSMVQARPSSHRLLSRWCTQPAAGSQPSMVQATPSSQATDGFIGTCKQPLGGSQKSAVHALLSLQLSLG